MKLKGLALLSFVQLSAQAAVVANLNSSPITFKVSGKDSDATRLYDSLSTTIGPNHRRLESQDKDFSIDCQKDVGKKEAACSIELYISTNVELHPEKDYAYYSLVDFSGSDTRPATIFQQLVKNKKNLFPMYFTDKQELAFSSSEKRFVFSFRKSGHKRLGILLDSQSWPHRK